MNIYDVLRHLVEETRWGIEGWEHEGKKAVALRVIELCEEANLLGSIALNIKED